MVAAVGARTAAAYDQIRNAIINGELKPGTLLVEMALAEMCGVSRTPVREALTRLEQDGLIVRVGSGLVVREHSDEEVLDIYETRIALEATAARLAAERRTSYDLIHLNSTINRLEAMIDPEPPEMASANRDFHKLVWQTSRNLSLIDLLERLDQHLSRYTKTTLAYGGRWQQSNVEHREIVEAIERRDSDAAGKIATRHFAEARDIRLKLFVAGTA